MLQKPQAKDWPPFIREEFLKSDHAEQFVQPGMLKLISDQKGRIGEGKFTPFETGNLEGADRQIRETFNKHWKKLAAEAGQ